ncbi:MAG: hypothetical protein HYW89_03210 [Candidatus Sungiibacteriota bacterium]|uniref:Uncharacterized protein n=1 Tax=Candidatus Sungiibacteriota bacterium TaxID=2750080 RepID=A0A7T5URU7_9BACT|nr:MAG: hypothetical protein HYW89_03210 [Candidatus Sungbacteria bacterium]
MDTKKPGKEIYISIDVETAGRIPPDFSMLSLGACVVYETSKIFIESLRR